MSYSNPAQTQINTVGLDAAITKLQQDLQSLTWIRKVFGRAYTHREIDIEGKTILIPKVWDAEKEWYDCRPNDIVISQSFFTPISEERINSFEPNVDPTCEQDVALIIWLNTDQLAAHDSGPSLGLQKSQVLEILKNSDPVINIESIVDKDAALIYEGFTITDELTHYTMLPYTGFRINLTVAFDYILCLQPSS